MLQTSGDYRCADPRYQTCHGTGRGVIERQGKNETEMVRFEHYLCFGSNWEKKKCFHLMLCLKNSKPGIKKKNTGKTKHGQIKRDELKCSVEEHHKSCLHDALGGRVGRATIWPKMCVFNLSGTFLLHVFLLVLSSPFTTNCQIKYSMPANDVIFHEAFSPTRSARQKE